MKNINRLILFVIILVTASFCTNDKNGNKKTVEQLQNQYKSFAAIQKSLDSEYAQFQEERDTLLQKLRLTKGAMDASVENFNDRYRVFLDKQGELVMKHNNVLGGIAQLQDGVSNGDISEEEALAEHNELIEKQKLVLETYKNSLLIRDSLLQEYDTLQNGGSAMLR